MLIPVLLLPVFAPLVVLRLALHGAPLVAPGPVLSTVITPACQREVGGASTNRDLLVLCKHALSDVPRQANEGILIEEHHTADVAAGDIELIGEGAHNVAGPDTCKFSDAEEDLDFVYSGEFGFILGRAF